MYDGTELAGTTAGGVVPAESTGKFFNRQIGAEVEQKPARSIAGSSP